MNDKPYRIEDKVLIDANNNRARINYWGSEEEAWEALKSCSGCSGCSDCSRCSGCSGCSRCSGCSGCSDCSDCSDCSGCSGYSGCSGMAPQKIKAVVPVIHDIHKKVFAAASKPGCLNMDTWHTCETTHCRAGWVVTLAGEAGKALEAETETLFAAMQIYKASGYEISPVRFFDNNEKALEDMRRLAEEPQPS